MEVGVGVSESWPGLLGPDQWQCWVQAAGSWVKVLYVSGTHQPDAHSTENPQTVNTVTSLLKTKLEIN